MRSCHFAAFLNEDSVSSKKSTNLLNSAPLNSLGRFLSASPTYLLTIVTIVAVRPAKLASTFAGAFQTPRLVSVRA